MSARETGRPSAAEIEAFLIDRLVELLQIDPRDIDVTEPLASYGLGSAEAIGLAGDLQEWLGQQVSATLAYEHPSIAALTRHLAGAAQAPRAGAIAESSEPMAIIGLSCRLPGAASPAAFWRLLLGRGDAITEVPAQRWDAAAFHDRNASAPGKSVSRWGGFLEHVDRFDRAFFGLTPREAARMDPQQRLLLELAWEALEDAGLVPAHLTGSDTAVFIGISTQEYARLQLEDPAEIDAFASTGNALSIAANRISYLMDWRGPSVAVDTACSSSLVALHLACASLARGEAALALVGGVNVILRPDLSIAFTKAGVMAPDGRCKAFDSRANGYVRGEGGAMVALKPLSRALRDGDSIYALVRGSAINSDGRTSGLLAPSRQAQEALLRSAYQRASVSPGAIQYVEAHGTGTLLGDQIEALALGTVLAAERPAGRACLLGSVKSNIGHLEAAAGITGVVKVALSLHHRTIPPSLHVRELNPHIPFADLPLEVVREVVPWPTGTPALAGVSSFGFGGANAHVVLQEAPAASPELGASPRDLTPRTQLVPLSARSAAALVEQARCLRDWLEAHPLEGALADVAWTLGARRAHHERRLALRVRSRDELRDQLQAFLAGAERGDATPGRDVASEGSPVSALRQERAGAHHHGRLVFVYPGQGPQWAGMARGLLADEPIFARSLAECDQALRPHLAISAQEALAAGALDGLGIDVLQPLLFAVQVALTALWRSLGVEPAAVVGHSMGEIAAAHAAGALSLEDAARVVCERSRLLRRLSGQGAMALIALSEVEAETLPAVRAGLVAVAASNGPTATVLSGDPAALRQTLAELEARSIFCRAVPVDVASHSPQVEALCPDLDAALRGVRGRPGEIPLYSTVTGDVLRGELLDEAYFCRNLREKVRFWPAVQQLVSAGHAMFVEISPHPVLAPSLEEGLRHSGRRGLVVPTLRRAEPERDVLLASLGQLYTAGHAVEFARLHPDGGRFVRLPGYRFQRERCWFGADRRHEAPRAARDGAPARAEGHPLLGDPISLAEPEGAWLFTASWSRAELGYLADHRVQGAMVAPAAAYLEMALHAARMVLPGTRCTLSDVAFHGPLVLPDADAVIVQLHLSPCPGSRPDHRFRIHSRQPGTSSSWTLHAAGVIAAQDEEAAPAVELSSLVARCQTAVAAPVLYQRLRDAGLEYGPRFQGVTALRCAEGECLAEVQAPSAVLAEAPRYEVHPALLDACLQALGGAVLAADRAEGVGEGPYVPLRLGRLRLPGEPRALGPRLWSHARLEPATEPATLRGTLLLFDDRGRLAAELAGLELRALDAARASEPATWLHAVRWEPAPRPSLETEPGDVLVLGDAAGIGERLKARIEARGGRCVIAWPGDAAAVTGHGPDSYRVAPESAAGLSSLLEQAFSGQPCRHIVHLWSVGAALEDSAEARPSGTEALDEAYRLGCGSVLHLMQALARAEMTPQLWLVTRGAQPAGTATTAPAAAPLWGLGAVIRREHPELRCTSVDLGDDAEDAAAEALYAELAAATAGGALALRGDGRHVPTLVRELPTAAPRRAPGTRGRPCEPEATYLVTGGLGSLGLTVAEWLVRRGARHLVLLGRSGPSAQAEQALAALRAAGARLHLARVDVSDPAQLAAALQEVARLMPPIRGVIHAAGLLADSVLLRQDDERFAAVMAPKVQGAWNLHVLTRHMALDFFVLFSSIAALLGSPGQGNYAAANAFLDALAHHRRDLGLPAVSIGWGPFAEVGMAAGAERSAHLAALGLSAIAPRQGMMLLEELLQHPDAHVAVIPWRASGPSRGGDAARSGAMLAYAAAAQDEWHGRTGAEGSGDAGPRPAASGAALSAVSLGQLASRLQEQVARLLGSPAASIDCDTPLIRFGLDSLMALELKNRVEAELGVSLPMMVLVQGPSINELAAQIARRLPAPRGRE